MFKGSIPLAGFEFWYLDWLSRLFSTMELELLSSELSAETLAALQAHLAAAKLNHESDVSEDFRLSQL
jgi:hypothetical protein